MSAAPEIRALGIEHGLFPWARSLNPKFSDDRLLLFATLDIAWRPPDPFLAIASVEQALIAFSPGAAALVPGAAAYHVFKRSRPGPVATRSDPPLLEGPLALAHLIEHAVIQFQCLITEAASCSGATAARRDPPGRFDLLIECRDVIVGRGCLALAIAWLTSIARGHTLGPPERLVLAVAGTAYRHRGKGLRPALLARMLQSREEEARRALSVLVDAGYLIKRSGPKGSRDAPEYRVGPKRS